MQINQNKINYIIFFCYKRDIISSGYLCNYTVQPALMKSVPFVILLNWKKIDLDQHLESGIEVDHLTNSFATFRIRPGLSRDDPVRTPLVFKQISDIL